MKIAFYLGSFNPFHNGHRDVILTAIKDFGMDKVIIVPSMQNPWKKEKVLDFDKRVEIICKAVDSIWFKDPKKYKKELSPLFNYISIENIENNLKAMEDKLQLIRERMQILPEWEQHKKAEEEYAKTKDEIENLTIKYNLINGK